MNKGKDEDFRKLNALADGALDPSQSEASYNFV